MFHGRKSSKANVGLELGLFDQLKFNLIIFEKRTGIYIQQESVPSIVNLMKPSMNLGEMKSRFRWFYGV